MSEPKINQWFKPAIGELDSLTVLEPGMRLRLAIKYRRLRHGTVAERAQLSTSQLSNYIAGRRKPGLAELGNLCLVLGIEPGWLIGLYGGWPPTPLRHK